MRTNAPSLQRTAKWIQRTASISTAGILSLTASAIAADPSKAGNKDEKAAKTGLVDAGQDKKRDGVVPTALEFKTFSPDRRLYAGYYRDGWDEIISIHDSASGKQIKKIVGHGDEVRAFKFTPDGKILASRCINRNRRGWALWEVATGKLLMRLPTVAMDTAGGARQGATAPDSKSRHGQKPESADR